MAYVFAGQRTIPASEELSRVIERQGVEKAVELNPSNENGKDMLGGVRRDPINALAILWSVTASWTSTQEKLIIAERNKLKNARHNKLIMIQINEFNSALHEKLRIVRHNKLMKARE